MKLTGTVALTLRYIGLDAGKLLLNSYSHASYHFNMITYILELAISYTGMAIGVKFPPPEKFSDPLNILRYVINCIVNTKIFPSRFALFVHCLQLS